MHPDKSPNHRGELSEMNVSTSGQESIKINTKEKYGDSSQYEALQHYQDPRYRTVLLTGPSHYSDKTEGSQHHHRVPHTGRPFYPDGTKDRMDSGLTTSRPAAHHETVTPSHITTSQYSSERYTGSLRDDERRYTVVTQSSAVLPSTKVLPDNNGYDSTRPRELTHACMCLFLGMPGMLTFKT